jgi:hypothetical protein
MLNTFNRHVETDADIANHINIYTYSMGDIGGYYSYSSLLKS